MEVHISFILGLRFAGFFHVGNLSLNLVDCFYVANDAAGVRLTPLAKLSAVAPTALQMMGLPVPPEMTTPSLLAGKEPWSKTSLAI